MATSNGTTTIATRPTDPLAIAGEVGYSASKLQLVKDTIARGATDDELALFLYTAHRAGLDPLARQIYCIQRWDSTLQRNVMSVQVSIDGLRLIADRTGRYAPGRASTYEYDKNGSLVAATAYVMKYVQGTWHEAAATAYYVEYVQTKKDGTPTAMWKSKPRIMLGKCAEALALRRAFPAELSGIYTPDEMGDDESRPAPVLPAPSKALPPADVVDGQVTEVEAPTPPPAPGVAPAEGLDFPPSPVGLMAWLAEHARRAPDNAVHLINAVRQESGNPKLNFPTQKDVDGWFAFRKWALQHFNAPAAYTGDEAETEETAPAELPF
jgi:phage recombination protein Bet